MTFDLFYIGLAMITVGVMILLGIWGVSGGKDDDDDDEEEGGEEE
tara:strand:+ start:523 stop:657 length:135 start_codon:yes stop_codon:yes gene_type:complete